VLVNEDFSVKRNKTFFSLFLAGNHLGEVLVFNIPPKGANITLKETITGKIKHLVFFRNKTFVQSRSSVWYNQFSIKC
jgi:hypothetical protein